MVNWNNPTTVFHEIESLVKLVYVVDGIFIWEFLSSMSYEWSIYSGRRPWRWTLWLYLGCRVFTLAAVVTDLTGFNVSIPINCQRWLVCLLCFSNLAFSFAQLLMSLRSLAIWNYNIFLTVFLSVLWCANVGLWIYDVTQAESVWDDSFSSCAVMDTVRVRSNILTTFATDAFLLLTLFVGLMRARPANTHGLRRLFYKQGLAWIAVATLCQTLPAVFVSLNLSDAMNLMFQTPALVATSIGATRIYRSITNFVSPNIAEHWGTSRYETNDEIRFRRQTTRYTTATSASAMSASAVPMSRLGMSMHTDERYVERFEAQDIALDDEQRLKSASTKGHGSDLWGAMEVY